MDANYLGVLNAVQKKAVQHLPEIPLQILAGPGSGKTRVLTSRITHLILHHHIPPTAICAVTFTNKASNEMRERLTKLIGIERTRALKLGTFHALCALFLRKHASVVGLSNNFSVCDADESKKLISRLLKPYQTFLEAKDITLKEATVFSMISKHKYKGNTSADVMADLRITRNKSDKENTGVQHKSRHITDEINSVVAEVYREYERSLRKSNSLDFDDLLLFGLRLFMDHKESAGWCRHVLVDEFQDTNSIQYELMKTLAVSAEQCLTVVGDPDQSIYGWRSADVTNLAKMKKDFPSTESILLEENYRSTASILKASLAIVSQDKARLPKSLHTSHPSGCTPSLVSFATDQDEAAFIAHEIKRTAANMGGILKWKDFAVLLRFNALSRVIESALQKSSIPCRILGGHKFFERMEIKDLLAYLQLVDNPQFTPAFSRVINVPARGIGAKTITELELRAQKTNKTPLELVELIHGGRVPDIKPPIKRKIPSFVKAIQTLRELATDGSSPVDLIRRLVDLIDYEQHLKQAQPQDWESRWENVQELITFASEVEGDIIEMDDSEETRSTTPLRMFLQASMLSSEGDQSNGEDSNDKVTISTCHAAKGLEWPVVIVPSVEHGTFPFYRCDDVEEERRLLYVACTRAQCLLYLSHCGKRMVSGETKSVELSGFVSSVNQQDRTIFSDRAPELLPADRAVISRVLGRPEPEHVEVAKQIAEFNRTTRHRPEPLSNPQSSVYNWHPSLGAQSAPPLDIITSSRVMLNNVGASCSMALCPEVPIITAKAGTRLLPTKPGVIHTTPTVTYIPQTRPSPTAPAQSSGPVVGSSSEGTGVGVKRRLGMGRSNVGYANKKFRPPT
ncbi:hypothetical protein EYR40_007995 [Pleurotus pulmonarius]|nr:hypothetical protein EYR40_007995 [Pleurotus pulmonarius]